MVLEGAGLSCLSLRGQGPGSFDRPCLACRGLIFRLPTGTGSPGGPGPYQLAYRSEVALSSRD